MFDRTSFRLAFCLTWFAASVMALGVDLSQVPQATQKLYAKFKAQYTGHNDRFEADAELLAELAATPDADLCFLDAVNPNQRDWQSIAARSQLGILNTQRTFDLVAADLKSKNQFKREAAIWIISAFKRPECVTLLVNILNNDPEEQTRVCAADALGKHAAPVSEPDLLRAAHSESRRLALAAVTALAPLKSKEGLRIAIDLMNSADKTELEPLINAVASYHNKAAVRAILLQFKRLPPGDTDVRNNRLREVICARLVHLIILTAPEQGTLRPDERLDQWEDFWAGAEPLLTDDLKLKTAKPAPRIWRDDEFAPVADHTSLVAELDANTFAVGEPIRLDLILTNTGQSPVSVPPPHLPSGWWSTMAYGVQLKRNDVVLLELAPSDFYSGSYAGPPRFETLASDEPFRSSVCLQSWLRPLITTPLPEGDYQLQITFDSAKFPGIKAKGIHLTPRWQAPVIRFIIRGEPIIDAREMLALIAKKAGKKYLLDDLASPQPARREPAWRAIFEYGDSRLMSFVQKFESEHPDLSYHYLSAENLRPYEAKGRPAWGVQIP
ncbi:MAG: HEAT repeat domain-containing protein [Phycisphaerales bacterium]